MAPAADNQVNGLQVVQDDLYDIQLFVRLLFFPEMVRQCSKELLARGGSGFQLVEDIAGQRR